MPSLLRPLTKMFAAWMVVGSGALIVVSFADQDQPRTPILATVEPIPCKQQAWPMMDRKCLTWTAPEKIKVAGDDVRPAERVASLVDLKPEETIAPPPPVAAKTPETKTPETKPAETKAAVVAEPAPAPEPEPVRATPVERAAAPRATLRPAPVTRNPALGGITVQARSTVGTRTIVVRPTNPQDALYYAARRNMASAGPVVR
jgi:hypothetical protein